MQGPPEAHTDFLVTFGRGWFKVTVKGEAMRPQYGTAKGASVVLIALVAFSILGLDCATKPQPGERLIEQSSSYLVVMSAYSPEIARYLEHIELEDTRVVNGSTLYFGTLAGNRVILMQANSGVPACIANRGMVDGLGRTAWISAPEGALESNTKTMIKSLVCWAAGDMYSVIKNDIITDQVRTTMYKILDKDMFQPLEVVLTLGYAY